MWSSAAPQKRQVGPVACAANAPSAGVPVRMSACDACTSIKRGPATQTCVALAFAEVAAPTPESLVPRGKRLSLESWCRTTP